MTEDLSVKTHITLWKEMTPCKNDKQQKKHRSHYNDEQ